MKIGLDRDERWPDYGLCALEDGPMRTAVVDDATVRRWRQAIRAYERAQNEMEKAFEAAEERP